MNTTTQAASESNTSPLGHEEIEALRESVEKVLASECDSRAVHDYIDGKSTLDQVMWSRAAELGWTAAALPENLGGLGLGPLGLQVLHYELGRRAVPGPYIATLSVAQWLSEAGTDEQKTQLLPLLASGQLTAAIPVTIGTGEMLTLRDSRLYGALDVLGRPDAGLVAAPVGAGGKVEAWVLFKPEAADATLQRKDSWDRTREVCRLECKGAAIVGLIPDADGSIGRRLQRHVSLALASDSLGAATQISHQTVEYLKTRIQFDKPIASFQAIKHRAADMVVSIATQRQILDQAVERAAEDAPDADMWAALAKAGSTKAFAFVAGDCIQLHGGVGHTWEYDPHIYAKRARLNEAAVMDNRAMLDFGSEALASASRAGLVTTQIGG